MLTGWSAAPAVGQTDVVVAEQLRAGVVAQRADSSVLSAQIQRFYASVGCACLDRAHGPAASCHQGRRPAAPRRRVRTAADELSGPAYSSQP
ncbi:hypothetical protein B0919_17200 [Hymenobacter sp. CRA2]|nr:hypothetical protein B0919_17200 [Hymenobacter sp. CRA2]